MTMTIFNRNSFYLIYGIPLLIFALSIGVAVSPLLWEHPELAIGVTYDLTITAPIIYLLLIRNTGIPKITVVPFITGGIFLGSFILPGEMQFHLNLVKYWILPAVELAVVGYVGFAAYKTIGIYKSVRNQDADVYTVLRLTCENIFDQFFSKNIAVDRLMIEKGKEPLKSRWYTNALSLEIAVFYYAFIGWKGAREVKGVFSYHKNSGFRLLYGAILFLLIAETVVLHIIIERWSFFAAWAITILSFYLAIQLFAHLKAMSQRPIEVRDETLFVRNGLFGEAEISLADIESIELSSIVPGETEGVVRASLLKDIEQFNTIVRVKTEKTFRGFYGMKSKFKTLLLYVDENIVFKKLIDKYESD